MRAGTGRLRWLSAERSAIGSAAQGERSRRRGRRELVGLRSWGDTALSSEPWALAATLCAEAGAWMVYLSTDYVFDGQPGGAPYAIDPTLPVYLYFGAKW